MSKHILYEEMKITMDLSFAEFAQRVLGISIIKALLW